MLSDLQKKTAMAIVNIFETGRALGEYGQVTVIKGDAGHLTYGRSQTTLASGNLYLLIKAYCDVPTTECATMLSPYLGRLASKDVSLDADLNLRAILREAGSDPAMHDVQDKFFDRIYWVPAEKDATGVGIALALGTAVVYDSHIHGSWGRVRDLTCAKCARPPAHSEQNWIESYVQERKKWLAGHSNAVLHRTVYRMNTFQKLIDDHNWELTLPIVVCGVRIEEYMLQAETVARASAHDENERNLSLQTPFMVGDDVAAVQRGLVEAGIRVDIDGIYGHLTEAAVRRFQQRQGLTVDGVVGPATRSALVKPATLAQAAGN